MEQELAHAATQHSGGVDLTAVIVLLAAAVVMVPIFRKIGLGSVLGFLAGGLLIGPFGLGFFEDPEAIIHVAELGVVLFLFVIGLEMQPSRLWAMRGEIFGLGALQVVGAILVLTGVGMAMGHSAALSFVAGTGFVLTSTAIVMQMLAERGQMATPFGRRIVAILLLEDLAIVPLLALVAFIAPGAEAVTLVDRMKGVAIGLGAIALLIVVGRYLLNPMFRFLARFGGRDVMTAAALLVVLGAATLMEAGGLSMAMGAFLAGVLLSESSFRHQLEADIEPFRGLLLGLFFLGVGMALNLGIVAANWTLIALWVPIYMVLKMAVIYAVARLLKSPRAEALERAVLMAQGGEFAFVLFSTAAGVGILGTQEHAILTAIIICSMVLTPLMVIAHDRLAPKAVATAGSGEAPKDLCANILLIGFDRVGQIVSQPLLARGHSLSIIETDAEMIEEANKVGFKVYYGDGSRLDILRSSGAADASLIIAAADDPEAVTKIVELVKHEFPMVPVLARARSREHAIELINAGADYQMRETFESALAISREALVRLGDTPDEAERLVVAVRARDVERLAVEAVEGLHAQRSEVLLVNAPGPHGHK